MKDYYKEIDTCLTRLEQNKYTIHTIDWCVSRIDWAWKWRKITRHQMEELSDRCCAILEADLSKEKK